MTKPKAKAVQTIDNETGEVTTRIMPDTSLPVPADFGGGSGLSAVKIKRQVTVPVLSWPDDATLIFKIETPIKLGKELKGVVAGKTKMEPASLCTIRGLPTDKNPDGQLRQLIVGAVLQGTLEEEYPKEAYVGLWFQGTKHAPNSAKGKRYATYSMAEIEDPT